MRRNTNNLSRRDFLNGVVAGATTFAAGSCFIKPVWGQTTDPKQLSKPNIVLILIDDMGWKDLGCTGSNYYETPNLDKLASEGMLFTRAHSACAVCGPSRAAIMTGRYPARLHFTGNYDTNDPKYKMISAKRRKGLALEEIIIPETLKRKGYISGLFGKWHLGYEIPVTEHGFDTNVGGCGIGLPSSHISPYFTRQKNPYLKDGPKGEYLTDRITDEACDFVRKNQDKPFFVYLSHYAVHSPNNGKPELVAKYKNKPTDDQNNSVFAAMVESVDDSVGKVVATLEELGLTEKTLIIFTSDNGGQKATSCYPLMAQKAYPYQGGTRVPFIVKWPGVIKPASKCETRVYGVDIYPTILDILKLKADPSKVIDGVSLVPLLKQTGEIKKRALYWHFPQYTSGGTKTGPYSCMIKDDWKFYLFYEDNGVQLFNLKKDPYELNDLSDVEPEKANELRKDLIAWKKAVNANDCRVNPKFDGKMVRGKDFSYKQAIAVRSRSKQLKRESMK